MAYLLDANVFIQAKNLHYGLDFCPGKIVGQERDQKDAAIVKKLAQKCQISVL